MKNLIDFRGAPAARENMSEDDNWQARWRKMMPFGPWSFPDIDEMMKEMEKDFMQFKDIEKQVPKDLIRERTSPDGSVRKEIGPIVYGYSMTIGPDGKPVIREFGNVKRSDDPLKGITDKREPLIDVVEGEKQVRIIAEIPGATKEDIEMSVRDMTLTISVDTNDRQVQEGAAASRVGRGRGSQVELQQRHPRDHLPEESRAEARASGSR